MEYAAYIAYDASEMYVKYLYDTPFSNSYLKIFCMKWIAISVGNCAYWGKNLVIVHRIGLSKDGDCISIFVTGNDIRDVP